MEQTTINNLKQKLEEAHQKTITVRQTGFVSNQIQIKKATSNIEYDTLNIKEDEKGNYVSINLNQVYKTDISEKEIWLYLDNDTQIKIEMN